MSYLAKQIQSQWHTLSGGFTKEEQIDAVNELSHFFMTLGEELEFGDMEDDFEVTDEDIARWKSEDPVGL